MSQEDTLRPGPDGSEGSHCGRGFEGGLGAANLCLGCWTSSQCRSRAPDGEGWEVSANSLVPVPRCPPPLTVLPRRCEDTLARLRVRISEALRSTVPDTQGSECTLIAGVGVGVV